MRVIISEKVPIKLWLDEIEDGALEQAKNIANLPFIFKHVSLMPDAHQGYGMPIGGVMATNGVVVPNAVGVDIGCGMCAVQSIIAPEELKKETLLHIVNTIRETIPLGFKHYALQQEWKGFQTAPEIPIIQQELESAQYQLGTLGGGNHFIEIQRGSDNRIWIMLHSGSRNFGFKIAKEYHEKAKRLCDRWFSNIPTKDLSFLPIEERDAKDYLIAMQYALDFAFANRMHMMNKIIDIFKTFVPKAFFGEPINIHHNYASWENHYGKNVLVHRKGATSAKLGQVGIIPGSQGTKSYIVEGLGNMESFTSCSHGAGRRLGRMQARRELSLQQEIAALESKGIIHSISEQKDLDEAPSAYKDIDVVMENQSDLVAIKVTLSPLAVIKASEDVH